MNETIMLRFEIDGEPVGKGRPRFTRSGHAYTPDKTANYEALIRLAFQENFPGFVPWECPVEVYMEAYFSIPKSFSKKRHQQAEDQLIRPTKKPDTDNIAKCKDALNGIAWKDDSQVVTEHVYKFYSDRPRLVIEVYKWEAGK